MTREEAIRRIKSWNLDSDDMEVLSVVIPELAESDDERVRRHLIDIVETYWGTTNDPGKAADLAWLEKQKAKERLDRMAPIYNDKESFESALEKAWKYYNESSSRTVDSFEDDYIECVFSKGFREGFLYKEKQKEQKPVENDTRTKIISRATNEKQVVLLSESNGNAEIDWDTRSLEDTKKLLEHGIAFVNKRLGMKPAEWSEDWREEDIQTRFAFYTYKDDPSVLYLSNVFVEETSRNHGFGTRILRAAEKVAEAIGATTISLKVKQNSPVNAWYRKNGYGYVAFEDGYDWLEKNLEYIKPNKQGRSEEDKETFEKLRRLLVICRGEKKFIQEADYNKMDNLLKSLRPPQYCENCKLKRSVENWKPSEEQMQALKKAAEYNFYTGEGATLRIFYNDLLNHFNHDIHSGK